MTSQTSSATPTNNERRSSDEMVENIKLYDFEEIEEHSAQMKKRLFITDFLKQKPMDSENNVNFIGKFSKMLSMVYNAYTEKGTKTEPQQDNVRQSIIEKFHQNWAIEYTSNGLYTLKESSLRLLNEDMISIASAKAMEWIDRRKILTCSDDLVSVTCCDDGKIKVYTKDLKPLISIDLNSVLHFDKHSMSFSISCVKISKSELKSDRYDIVFLYEQSVYLIPLLKDSSTIQTYKLDMYTDQILSFDIFNDSEKGRIISLVLAHGEQECIFLNYPELESSALVKVEQKPKHVKLPITTLDSNDLNIKPKISFSRDGTLCAFLCSKTKKLYFYRVPFPFKNDSRIQSTSTIENVLEFNWWSTSSIIICSTLNQLSVVDIYSKTNILGEGDVTEDVEGMPLISSSHNGKFFMLEYEPNVNQLHLDQQILLLQEQQREMDKLENAPETSLLGAFSTLFSFLFPKAIKEPEELKEENMIPSTLSLAYRLYRFCEKEPEKEFQEKLAQGDLNEALLLAKSYSLDLDQVYKKMWKRQVISLFSIETLKQVSDKRWVIDECLQRISTNEESMRALLECGLETTGELLKGSADDDEISEKRLNILYFLDRLDLYLQLSDQIKKEYKSDQYNSFRNCDLLEYAKERASMKDLESLRVVLSYGLRVEALKHKSRSISPHLLLEILSFIPESLDPNLYEDMLPSVDSGKMKRWDHISMTRIGNDVCEEKSPKSDAFYPSTKEIAQWYMDRAETIDITSGMVSYAETLLSIGISKNVPGLEEKCNELQFLSQMIYNKGNLFNLQKQLLSIRDYEENMSNYDKFKLLINKNSSDIVSQLLNKGLNFVQHCDEEKTGKDSLIYRYIIQELAPYNFEQCTKILSNTQQRGILLGDNETITLLAIECIYAAKNFKENTENIIRVLNSLPNSGLHNELEEQVNQLKRNTLAVTILSKHNISTQLSLSMDLEKEGENIMQELLQASIKSGARSEKSFQSLYSDLNNLHKSCLAHLPLRDVYHQFLKNCCLSGHAHLAYEYVVSKRILSFDEADDAIYEAATELVNSSVQPTDSSIMIAEKCTSLHQSLQNEKHISISQEHRWKRERDILEVFRLIGKEYQNYPPALFLKKNTPVEVIKYLIENNSTGTDENTLELFYNISKLLGGTDNDKKEIKKLAIEVSLEQAGSGNVLVIKTLMEQKHAGVYKICSKMSIDATSNLSYEDRLRFASYSIQNCNASELSEMISNYELIESQKVYDKSTIKPLTECVHLAHQEFEKLSKITSFNANFVGCTPLYSSYSEDSLISKFGISSKSISIDHLLNLKTLQLQTSISTNTDIETQSLLDFASLSLLSGNIISFLTILIQVPISQIGQIKTLFDSILSSQPRDTKSGIVERILRVFNLYFGLRLLLLENPDGLSDYYDELSIGDIVEKSLESDLKDEFPEIVDILTLYNGLLYICDHFNELASLSKTNLSCLRFISEEDYRIKSLNNLAQTTDRGHLETILQVTDKLKLEKNEFYLCYLETVLKNKIISQEEKSFIFEFITSMNNEKVIALLLQYVQPSVSREYHLSKLVFLMDMLSILGCTQYQVQKSILETLIEECKGITTVEYNNIINAKTSEDLFDLLKSYISVQNIDTILESLEQIKDNIERPSFYFFIVESVLKNSSVDSKEKPSIVEDFVKRLTNNQINHIITKLSFDNAFKLPHAIRILIMKNSLKHVTDPETRQLILDNIFRMLAAKRVFQKEELDNLLGLLDRYFRNEVGLIHILSNIALYTKNKTLIDSVLNDLKEEYESVYTSEEQQNNVTPPLFLSLDTKQAYLKIVDEVIKCLVDHFEELSNETESNEEEDLTQQELESFTYEENGLCWPPNTAKLACTYLHIIIGSLKDIPDLFNSIVNHIETIAKNENDFPVRTRIALVRIMRKYKKPTTPSNNFEKPCTPQEPTPSGIAITPIEELENIEEKQEPLIVETSDEQDSLLAIYQTKDAIGENFPTQKDIYSQAPKPPSGEFREVFNSLLSVASSEKQLKALSFILRIWYKEKKQHQPFLESLLVELFHAMLNNSTTKESTVLEVTAEQAELLNESKARELFEQIVNKGSNLLACNFALQFPQNNIKKLAVERITHLGETKPEELDSEEMSSIMNTCISKNMAGSLVLSKPVLQAILHSKKLRLSELCEPILISELVLCGLKQQTSNYLVFVACEYLQKKVYGMHTKLCDLNGSLFLLRRFLQQAQTHTKFDKNAKEQCTTALKKLTNIQ